MTDEHSGVVDSDDDVRRLLELAGPRHQPPADVEARVRAATLAAWELMPEPAQRHTFAWAGLAAALLLGVLVGFQVLETRSAGLTGAGRVVFADAPFTVDSVMRREVGPLETGSRVATADGYLFVELAGGGSARLDQHTRVTVLTPSSLQLDTGRIYVDVPVGADVTVTTRHAAFADVGTTFEVAAAGDLATVVVREGRVDVALAGELISVRAADGMGEMLNVDAAAVLSRSTLATTDPRWAWTQRSRPRFDLSTGSLYDYLDWAARETGRELAFANELARQQASTARAHGKVNPGQVSDLLAATGRFRQLEGKTHQLLIGFLPY